MNPTPAFVMKPFLPLIETQGPDVLEIAVEAARRYAPEGTGWFGMQIAFIIRSDGEFGISPRNFWKYASHVRVDT